MTIRVDQNIATTNGAPRRVRWQPVNKRNPCPACGKPDWCAWSPDNKILRCMRSGNAPVGMKLAKHDAEGGTLFVSTAQLRNGSWHKRPTTKATQARSDNQNRDRLAERFRAALTQAQRDSLAAALGVTAAALDAVGVGWAKVEDLRMLMASGTGWPDNPPDGAFAFPERDGTGRIVGFSLRANDGRKGAPSSTTGCKRGLIVPTGLHDTHDEVLVVEGASDAAACVVLGLPAVGRPSNNGGAEQLSKLLKYRPALVVGENDANPAGAWPGRDGAERVAQHLATSRGESVACTLPPRTVKDVCAWLNDRVSNGLDLADADACRMAGQELLAALRGESAEVEPQKGPSVAEQLVRLALGKYRFSRTDKAEPFAVEHNGPNVAIMLKGSADALRAKLAREYRALTGRTPGASALADALTVLIGESLDAEAEPVALRLAAQRWWHSH